MHTRRGFTAIELAVTLAIITVLLGLAVFRMVRFRSQARLSRVSGQLADIAKAATQYAQDNANQYPAEAAESAPSGLERYLAGGVWPPSVWPHGVFDWDAGADPLSGEKIYQVSYRLCGDGDPEEYCRDSALFPEFTRYSSIFYCISGPCVPHLEHPEDPGYCVNCPVKKVNYE